MTNTDAAVESTNSAAQGTTDQNGTVDQNGKATNGHTAEDAAAAVKKETEFVSVNKTLGSYMSSGDELHKKHVPQTSPEVKAGFFNQLFFVWLNNIIARGSKTALMDEDMYEVNPDVEAAHCSQLFEKEWAIELAKQRDSGLVDGKPVYEANVTMACYRIFKTEFWVGGCCKAVIDGLQFLQPILLEWLLKFIADTQNPPFDGLGQPMPPDVWKGYVYAVCLGLNPFFVTVLSNLYFRVMMTIGLRARTILVAQLYKKSLRLSPSAKQRQDTGTIVNMMSTDASKVDLFMGYVHYLWSALEQVIIAIALLVRAIGPPALAGVAVVIIMLPIQGFVMKKLQMLRMATVKYTDARVKLMNEILQGIRVIKVYAWEGSFMQKLIKVRAEEMAFVKKAAYTRAYNSTLMQTGPILMSLLAFITLGLVDSNFEPQYIFSSLVLFNLLRMPLLLFPMTLSFWSDARIGVKRITAFLLAEELSSEPTYVEKADFAVSVVNADFSWEKVVDRLKDEEKEKKEAAAATGVKVADAKDGKTANGQTAITVDKSDSLSPSPSPGAAVERAEVLPFHMDGMNFTVPKGSLTVIVGAVGSGKSSLFAGILGEMKRTQGDVLISGSVGFVPQQAWIQNASLKDNILFGLPFDQKKYDDAIKYCALAADIEILPAKDLTEIGEKGINLSGGQKARTNFARAVYFDADIVLLDDPFSAVDAHVSKYLFNSCVCEKLKNKTRILVTHQLQYVSACDQVIFLENGRIAEMGTYSKLMSDRKNFYTLMSTYVGTEDEAKESDSEEEGAVQPGEGETEGAPKKKKIKGLKSARKSSAGDKKAKAEMTAEEKKKKADEKKAAEALMQAEERTKGGVPMAIYLYYMRHAGGWIAFLLCMFFMFAQTADSSWVTWWLGLWTSRKYDHGNNWYLGIYAGLGLGQCFFALVGTVISALMGVRGALALHNKSFNSVLRAPLSFFDTTPIGRIISRFSKDQDVIDSLLMDTLRMIVFMMLTVAATFVMICYVTPWFLIPLAPIMFVYWYIQRSYRETSRELKRLESIARSPLFAHFSETLTGLATIRAYRAQSMFTDANVARINGNNRAYYLLVLTQRWLSIRVETIGSLVAFFAALIIVIQRNSTSAGSAGVSLSYSIGVTALLNWVVRQTVEAENCMNSVERCKFYTDAIAQEAPASIPDVDGPLEKTWPTKGAIEFKDLKIRYRPNLPLVLHGISLNIKGGERIGIVGRTGAGKSSLMVALFRIVEAAAGTILIDGVDISKIGLDALRTKLAIIPQDPVLYSGTVRSNLDPFNQYTDADLWDVLGKSYLREKISGLDKKLEEPVSENGENFSLGERAQICLARAMLRKAKVLIMDEATASVDMETDAFIQNSLRKNFDSTLLTIAHRLNTICDYDRVLVLDFGNIKEFDTPANLLRDPNSVFSSMVNETGEVNAQLLRSIAFKAEQGYKVDMAQVLQASEGGAPDGETSPDAAGGAAASSSSYPLVNDTNNDEPASVSRVVWHIDEE